MWLASGVSPPLSLAPLAARSCLMWRTDATTISETSISNGGHRSPSRPEAVTQVARLSGLNTQKASGRARSVASLLICLFMF